MLKAAASLIIFALFANAQIHQAPSVKRKPTADKLSLSPLIARLAYNFHDEISQLRSLSDEVHEFESESPFSRRDHAISKELDRIEEFDVRTDGDHEVLMMLGSFLLLATYDKALSALQSARATLLLFGRPEEQKAADGPLPGDEKAWSRCSTEIYKIIHNRRANPSSVACDVDTDDFKRVLGQSYEWGKRAAEINRPSWQNF
jgi:hypothetical protein